jgi:hypothetical protein
MGNATVREPRPILIVMAFLAGAPVATAAYGQEPGSRAKKPSDDQQRREWRQLIEALRKPADSQWRYGLTRRSAGALEARHHGKLVWQVPWSSNLTNPRLVNMSFVVRSTP